MLAGLCFVGVVSTLTILAAPTTTRYSNLSDVVEEIIGCLFMTGGLFTLPGILVALGVIWVVRIVSEYEDTPPLS